MDSVIQKVLYSILIIPFLGVLIYSIVEPEKSFLFGRKWQYKNEDLEPSESMIKMNRKISIVALVVIICVYLYFIFS